MGKSTQNKNAQNKNAQNKNAHNINEEIRAKEVRLVDETGKNVGVVSTKEALNRALDTGLDLVEVSPNAVPPVAKIIDYGKYRYEQQKKAAEARKKQKTVDIKEIKFRPNTDENDFNIKMRNVKKFISQGNKVKITLRYRGREMAHQEIGVKLINRVVEEMQDIAKVDGKPNLEGRQMMMMLTPLVP